MNTTALSDIYWIIRVYKNALDSLTLDDGVVYKHCLLDIIIPKMFVIKKEQPGGNLPPALTFALYELYTSTHLWAIDKKSGRVIIGNGIWKESKTIV